MHSAACGLQEDGRQARPPAAHAANLLQDCQIPGRRLSFIVSLRQVSAGTSFVKETIRSLTQQFPSMKRVAVVDALGYDGSVPMAVLEDRSLLVIRLQGFG